MYAKIINGEVVKYPYSIKDLRADYTNTSFPNNLTDNDLLSYNVHKINTTPKPACERNQRVEQSTPIFEDGVWKQSWETITLSEEEYNALIESLERRVRTMRDSLLKEYVDTMSPIRWESLTDEQKQIWRDYRQDLLDVTEQANFPWEINWPDAPE